MVYLNEQKVESLTKAALCADEFVLTHQGAFSSASYATGVSAGKNPKVLPKNIALRSQVSTTSPDCFYCHEAGHLHTACPAVQCKDYHQCFRKPKSVGFVKSVPSSVQSAPVSSRGCSVEPEGEEEEEEGIDELYKPFIT